MSEIRTGKFVGRIHSVLYYPNEDLPVGCAHRMKAMPEGCFPEHGQYVLEGRYIYFHESDRKLRKLIVYQSVEQVQRTTRGKTKVRLCP